MVLAVRRGGLDTAAWHPLRDVGGSPIEPAATRVAIAWDDRALHVAFEMSAEPPLAIAVREPHGPVYEDECAELFLCGAGEETRYLELVVNPAGTLYAARVDNPEGSRATWRLERGVEVAGLSVEVSGEPVGPPRLYRRWSCRLRLAWSGAAPQGGEARRGNLFRIARGRHTRFEALSPTGRDQPPDFHVPARFATLRFE